MLSGDILRDFTDGTLVAMSGGVDSAVAALLLMEKGIKTAGITFLLTEGAESEAEAAKRTADLLGIPHMTAEYREAFINNVIEPFVRSYESGEVPNPCVLCNRTVKFAILSEACRITGASHFATGHYARVERDGSSGRYLLKTARDMKKDQTYMLYSLSQDVLSRAVFPLGDMTKDEVRAYAEKKGFDNARKKDSQDICFIKDTDHVDFISRYRGKQYPSGDFLDMNGNVIGTHGGAIGFTVGQRKGFGMGFGQRVYVVSKDMDLNTVTLGSNEDLFKRRVTARNISLIPFDRFDGCINVTAKTRYNSAPAKARVFMTAEDELTAEFYEPVRAVTNGQSLVLYDGDTVVGGGIISGSEA